jgi:hypothetical protein
MYGVRQKAKCKNKIGKSPDAANLLLAFCLECFSDDVGKGGTADYSKTAQIA